MKDLSTKKAVNEILRRLDDPSSQIGFDYARLDSIEYALGVLFGFFCFYLFFQVFQSRLFK